MDDQQRGSLATLPVTGDGLAELERVARWAEAYNARGSRSLAYLAIRKGVPGFTREHWSTLTGTAPDTSEAVNAGLEPRQNRHDRDWSTLPAGLDIDQWAARAGVVLPGWGGRGSSADMCREPGSCPSCQDIRAAYAAYQAYRPGGGLDMPEADSGSPCECDSCDLDSCDGECDACSDHGCSQCWPEGCGEESYQCCGYCSTCDSHTGDSRDEVCDKGHCHDCDHTCEGY